MKKIKIPLVIFGILPLFFVMLGCGGGGGGGGGGGNPVGTVSETGGETVSGKIVGTGDLGGISVFLVPSQLNRPVTTIRASLNASAGQEYYSSFTETFVSFMLLNVSFWFNNLDAI